MKNKIISVLSIFYLFSEMIMPLFDYFVTTETLTINTFFLSCFMFAFVDDPPYSIIPLFLICILGVQYIIGLVNILRKKKSGYIILLIVGFINISLHLVYSAINTSPSGYEWIGLIYKLLGAVLYIIGIVFLQKTKHKKQQIFPSEK